MCEKVVETLDKHVMISGGLERNEFRLIVRDPVFFFNFKYFFSGLSKKSIMSSTNCVEGNEMEEELNDIFLRDCAHAASK
jgi:hypothetical protein